jgi:uncharacterized C2H2 Zn-finger protein
MQTLTYSSTLGLETCCNCGMSFGMPVDYQRRRREDHGWFHCPAGHAQHYAGKSEEEKLRDELTREKHRTEQARAEADDQRARKLIAQRSIRARKGVATRLRNKIAAGKCPCCSASFKDLKQHMQAKHPKWDLEKAAVAIAGTSTDG